MIRFENIKKSFKTTEVIKNLNFTINKGEFVVFIGESGCGKTTTMKMINRLIEPSSGKIFINDEDTSKASPIELRRNIGYVIQKVGLFPHMTVGENVELVPLLKHWPEAKREERAIELLDLVGLPASEYMNRYPHELSGGQRQRIGIARALAVDPDIILMDEPFSALDPITREQLQDEMIRLQEEVEKTIVLVSHDMDEAIKMANKIAVMQHGKIVQYDAPEEILMNPANDFVENFVGKDRLWRQPDLLTAKDLMIKSPQILQSRHIAEAIERMKERRSDYLIVVNQDGKYVGYVTTKEVKKQGTGVTMADIKKDDLQAVNLDQNLVEVVNIIKDNPLRFVPVTDHHNKVIGVITKSSLLNVISDLMPSLD